MMSEFPEDDRPLPGKSNNNNNMMMMQGEYPEDEKPVGVSKNPFSMEDAYPPGQDGGQAAQQ